jgi:N-acetylglucosaminyl-diphospho-decaprenol L-rhamnosyltransferase
MTSSAIKSGESRQTLGITPEQASVAVVTVNYRTAELTKACLASLVPEKAALPKLEIVVVDAASGDGSAEELAAAIGSDDYRGWVSLLALPVNGGFGWANNRAITHLMSRSRPDFVHLLNPDSEIEAGAVRFLIEYLLTHPRTGAVGSQLLEPDGSVTGSAFSFPTIRGELARGARTALVDRLVRAPPISIPSDEPIEVDWATGASVMFRVDALREVGLFDEGFFLYHEEIELMWRLRKRGWTIAFEPRSRVRHVGGAATGVHSRQTPERLDPRKPAYWYRSRSRFFALTRGKRTAAIAFLCWLVGHGIWRIRRAAGIASNSKPVDHQLRDHLRHAFPKGHDSARAAVSLDASPSERPAWMERAWL